MYVCTPKFTAALFTIAKMWKEPKYVWTHEWIDKIWYTHAMDYYSALKERKI